nr:immunoglobulin heavy chain junction region [Mus musculus]MBK4196327.1 immunoglobulin heavy chain junction region [Mus musculus]
CATYSNVRYFDVW